MKPHSAHVAAAFHGLLLSLSTAALCASHAFAQPPVTPAPLIKQDSRTKVAEHTYVILDDGVGMVPNVGLVVGNRATLIIDTGLGERNGAIVLQEARKLSRNTQFYLTATHFHPEHDLGATAFPADAKMLRWRRQQAEADQAGAETIRRFAGFSPIVAQLLDGARFRAVDIEFDDEIRLDLGGVHVRIWGVGPNHTLGDTAFFVEEDRVLFTGDTVMPVFPSVSAASASLGQWLENLVNYEALQPVAVVPAHGRLSDVALVRRYREYFDAVRQGVTAGKRDGQSVEAIAAALGADIARQFTDLTPANGQPSGRINAAIQAAYRAAE